jgi:anti-anti-sigma regulatory factor
MKKKSGKPAAELQPGVLSLPGSVAIRNARELREHWLTHVSSPALQVDASAVSDVDTAGLQLLLAWKRAVAAGGGKFEWSQVSAPLRDAATAVGLGRELGLPGAT